MNQNGERVTRADVAKEAGVSETIVSYVVNNNRYVAKINAPEWKKRLRSYIIGRTTWQER